MRKITPSVDRCESWKPGRNAKGEVMDYLPEEAHGCWSCYYNLFGYCWIEDKEPLLSYALEDVYWAKQELHGKLEKMDAKTYIGG